MNNDSTALYAFKKYGNTVLRAAFAFCGRRRFDAIPRVGGSVFADPAFLVEFQELPVFHLPGFGAFHREKNALFQFVHSPLGIQ